MRSAITCESMARIMSLHGAAVPFRTVASESQSMSRAAPYLRVLGEGKCGDRRGWHHCFLPMREYQHSPVNISHPPFFILSCKPISYCRFERIDVYIL